MYKLKIAKENINKINRQLTYSLIHMIRGWNPKFIYKELIKLNTKKNNPVKKWAKDLNRHFSKEDVQIAKRYMKRQSMSLIIRKMEIRYEISNDITMRYHFTPVRMAIINKSTNNKCRWGCGERGILLHCWWECRLVQPLWKAVWSFLKK